MSNPDPQSHDADRLQTSNAELSEWMSVWENEMTRAGGERVHMALLKCMWYYVRLLNNSFFLGRSLSNVCAPPLPDSFF